MVGGLKSSMTTSAKINKRNTGGNHMNIWLSEKVLGKKVLEYLMPFHEIPIRKQPHP